MTHSILIIDDSRLARSEIRDILAGAVPFTAYHEAEDGLEGFKQLLAEKVDVVLCDYEMPGSDGLQFLRLVANREDLAHLPVIMLLGREEQEAKVRVLDQGASDYVTKPFDPAELLARVKIQLKIKTLQDSLRDSNRQLLEFTSTDPLTGLPNRRTLMENLEREFARSRRNHRPISLVMADIDHFKMINDGYGHQDGDQVLVTFANLLRRHLRQSDLAARFGGEEFCLVLPETPGTEAAAVAERIRTATAECLFEGELRSIRVTASLGVATFPRSDISGMEDLIREADDALYLAKRQGRNRVELSGLRKS